MKTKQENDVINCIGVVYAEKNTELSWLIRPGVIYYENLTRQRHAHLYIIGSHQKQCWVVMFD